MKRASQFHGETKQAKQTSTKDECKSTTADNVERKQEQQIEAWLESAFAYDNETAHFKLPTCIKIYQWQDGSSTSETVWGKQSKIIKK